MSYLYEVGDMVVIKKGRCNGMSGRIRRIRNGECSFDKIIGVFKLDNVGLIEDINDNKYEIISIDGDEINVRKYSEIEKINISIKL